MLSRNKGVLHVSLWSSIFYQNVSYSVKSWQITKTITSKDMLIVFDRIYSSVFLDHAFESRQKPLVDHENQFCRQSAHSWKIWRLELSRFRTCRTSSESLGLYRHWVCQLSPWKEICSPNYPNTKPNHGIPNTLKNWRGSANPDWWNSWSVLLIPARQSASLTTTGCFSFEYG